MLKDELTVFADEQLVWDGALSEHAFSLQGPVGLRSDNVRFEFELLASDNAP